MLWLLLLLVGAGNVLGQENYRIVREGPYWARIDLGVLAAPLGAKVKIISPGKVHLQGEYRDNIAYLLKRRVRAKDLESARRQFAAAPVRYAVRGEWVVVTVPGVDARNPAPELELRVPRSLRQTAFHVEDGTVSAYDMDGPVSVEAKAGSVVMDRIHSSVAAHTGGGEIRLGKIRGSIRCLSGGGGISIEGAGRDSILETAGGEVCVREAIGPVVAITGGGNIQVLRALSQVTANTSGGLVEVNQASGMVRANTAGGGIQIGVANGVRCESSAGTIDLQAVTGALRASTLMGSIQARIQGVRLEDSFLDTSAGDITVFLPSNLAVTVQAENETMGAVGRILSEFPEIRLLTGALTAGGPIEAQGVLNGGGPMLRLSATGGIIYLRRRN